jgi:hypothetical protein
MTSWTHSQLVNGSRCRYDRATRPTHGAHDDSVLAAVSATDIAADFCHNVMTQSPPADGAAPVHELRLTELAARSPPSSLASVPQPSALRTAASDILSRRATSMTVYGDRCLVSFVISMFRTHKCVGFGLAWAIFRRLSKPRPFLAPCASGGLWNPPDPQGKPCPH